VATEIIPGRGFRLRRARREDAPFLLELVRDEDTEPFLSAVGPRDEAALGAEIERSLAEPRTFGRFVLEVAAPDGWQRAGALGFEVSNRRSRIARLGGLAVHPAFRGRRLADAAARALQRYLFVDLDLHRLELECYGFNERAIRHAERSGFVREGVKRRAYWRHEQWVDGVLFGMLREDFDDKG
jgi:RimJ/RimL family protein N-acetyltransferase